MERILKMIREDVQMKDSLAKLIGFLMRRQLFIMIGIATIAAAVVISSLLFFSRDKPADRALLEYLQEERKLTAAERAALVRERAALLQLRDHLTRVDSSLRRRDSLIALNLQLLNRQYANLARFDSLTARQLREYFANLPD